MLNFRTGFLFPCLFLMPNLVHAAGTYYTGAAYQPTQYRYGQTGTYATSSGYNQAGNYVNSMQNARYNNYAQTVNNYSQNTNVQSRSAQQTSTNTAKKGLFLNAGITHEKAMWKYDMKTAGSILHYDNVEWNVFDLTGGYAFDMGKTKMQVDAGFKYGIQWGETSMIDDDISNGGFSVLEYYNNLGTFIGAIEGHSFSIGTSKDGTMLGFNAGFGLTDFLKLGNMKITPSIGYRYLQYKLETQDNYGTEIYTVNGTNGCVESGGESVCGVALLFYQNETDAIPSAIVPANSMVDIGGLTSYYLDTTDTHYFTQSGTSHSYEVAWSGPYVALDMAYEITQNNAVNGRVEFGFPRYTSTGDQPYRWDWAHPKSVEDSADMFSGFHFGMVANWTTAITNSVALSLGVTYDYYTVSGADATTYFNKSLYNQLVAYNNNDETALLTATLDSTLRNYLLDTYNYASVDAMEQKFNSDSFMARTLYKEVQSCGGWVCKASKEIDSIYKSMGIRVGINARF